MRTPLILPLLLVTFLTGCVSFPKEKPPKTEAPTSWRFKGALPMDDGNIETQGWVRAFGSQSLAAVVTQCLESSTTVLEADARLAGARAAMMDSRSRLYPQVAWNGARTSFDRLSGDGIRGTGSTYSWTLSGAWDLDVWGENRSSLQAAEYLVDAQRYATIAARVDLVAAVTATFIQLSALRERLSIARRNLESAERTQRLVASRIAQGYAMPIDLVQQDALISTQRVAVALLQQQVGDSEIALARLLDVAPSAMSVDVDPFDQLSTPKIGPGLPAQLLFRRPDVSQAEASLLAADANLQAARAAALPGVNFGALLNDPGSTLSTLLRSPLYSVAASVVTSVFDGGHLRAQRELAAAQKQALLAQYRRSVVNAYADVESALNAINQTTVQTSMQEDAVSHARRALALSEARYRGGSDTFLNVLDTQRSVFYQEDLAVQVRLAKMLAGVALFKAIGGGWRVDGAASDYY